MISNRQIVLNVGNIFRENIKRKGIGMFLETGRKSPEYEFVHIGAWKDTDSVELLQRDLAENCSLLGYVDTQVHNPITVERYFMFNLVCMKGLD